jgi:hypothetical protein
MTQGPKDCRDIERERERERERTMIFTWTVRKFSFEKVGWMYLYMRVCSDKLDR